MNRSPDDEGHGGVAVDREIAIGAVLRFMLWLGGFTAAAMVMVWFFLGGLLGASREADPAPGPLAAEARAFAEQGPPEPRLRVSGASDMEILRAHEQAILESYGWLDGNRQVARVPVDRAIDLLVERGTTAPLVAEVPPPLVGDSAAGSLP